MDTYTLQPTTLNFLTDLGANNHREWFQENKERYEQAHLDMIAFSEALLDRMQAHDRIEPMSGKKMLFRIYRDVRFSKNKDPYKTHWAGSMRRATPLLRGGYYYHIQPGNGTFIAGGFWNPNPDDLKRIREEFAMDDQPIRKIIADPKFQQMFGDLEGEGVKTAPKGFSRDHPAMDLIRKKQFIVYRNFSDEEVLSGEFLPEVVRTYEAMRPFFDYMSEVLTTDLNGARLPDLS